MAIGLQPGAGTRRRLVALLVAAALVVVGGYHAARLVLLAVAGPDLPPVAVVAPVPSATNAAAGRHDPADAADWTLFGDATAATATGTPESAPATTLQLQLLGVFSVADEKLAGAVIAERGGAGDLYRIGAAVPGGATLERVEPDRVLLRRRGQLETLRFEQLAAGGGAASPTPGPSSMLSGFRNVRDRLGQPDLDRDEEVETARSPRAMVESLAGSLQEDPEGAIAEFGLQKASGGGYEVTDKSPQSLRNLGLRPGDVVLSVNGQGLGDPVEDAALVEQVRGSGEARIEIRRGSQVFTVNHPL
jgi:general secretion pathway protein C